jgi:hypothetical protein
MNQMSTEPFSPVKITAIANRWRCSIGSQDVYALVNKDSNFIVLHHDSITGSSFADVLNKGEETYGSHAAFRTFIADVQPKISNLSADAAVDYKTSVTQVLCGYRFHFLVSLIKTVHTHGFFLSTREERWQFELATVIPRPAEVNDTLRAAISINWLRLPENVIALISGTSDEEPALQSSTTSLKAKKSLNSVLLVDSRPSKRQNTSFSNESDEDKQQ